MINDILQQLGFNEKEIAVYLTVLEHGKITPASVSRLTNINRSTVYAIAKELTVKGVIVEDLGGKQGYLVALPPQDLQSLLLKEERALQNKKLLVNQAIESLQSYSKNTKYSIPKIHFVDEEDLENYLYKQTPTWNQSVTDNKTLWWGFQDANFVKHYEDWIDWFWEEGNQLKTELKVLSNEVAEKAKQKKFSERKIRYWDGSAEITATTWIAGDYIIMVVTSQRPYYLVEIHDAVMAKNFREVFKSIWNGLEGVNS